MDKFTTSAGFKKVTKNVMMIDARGHAAAGIHAAGPHAYACTRRRRTQSSERLSCRHPSLVRSFSDAVLISLPSWRDLMIRSWWACTCVLEGLRAADAVELVVLHMSGA